MHIGVERQLLNLREFSLQIAPAPQKLNARPGQASR